MYNGTVNIYNHETALAKAFDASTVPVRCVCFIARKNWLVAGSDDFQLCVFNYNTHDKVASFEAHLDYIRCLAVTTVTSHPILRTPSRVYMQPCSPWTRPDPTRSTTGPFRPLSLPSRAVCSICDAYVSAHDALLFLSVSREHR